MLTKNLTIDEILEQIKKICLKNGVNHLYLFGSYASGTQTETSDIDIVVKGVPDYGKLYEEIQNIPTLKTIDIFEYEKCLNPYLRDEIDSYAKPIY